MEVHMLVFTLFTVMVSSEEVKENLTGTVGGSITLPDPVEDGFLLFGVKNIAMVNERNIKIYDQTYKDKVRWNSSTGLFTITRLQRNDSGIYSIDSKTGKVFFNSYELTIYESVSTPSVETLNVSAESCTLQCFVEKAEKTTLFWYKDERILNQSSLSLSLSLTVLKEDFSSSYRCVAANPADQKTLLINVTTSCSYEHSERSDNPRGAVLQSCLFLIPMVVFVIAAAIYVMLMNLKAERRRETTTAAPSEINGCQNKHCTFSELRSLT